MKKENYNMSKLKHSVLANRDPNKLWGLNKEQIEMIEKLGGTVQPVVYRTRTRKLKNQTYYKTKNPLLRELHYANKNGKDYISKKLKPADKNILNEQNIPYYPKKYTVVFHNRK